MRSIVLYIVIFSLACTGCSRWHPSVSFKAEKNGNLIEFHFGYQHTDGLGRMMIWEKESKTPLWDINLAYYCGSILQYGDVPMNFRTSSGVHNSAVQKYPTNAQKPTFMSSGKEIIVLVEYIANDPYPCVLSKWFSFRINNDGTITNFGEVPSTTIIKEPVILTPNQDGKPQDSNSLPNHG